MNSKDKKYIVILGDGMADYEDESGNTPLSLARTPCIDALASRSVLGLCQTIPDGLKPGSDTANLSVMGYDPHIYYTGRSPLEAISIGIPLSPSDVTYRANLVTLGNEEKYADKTMIDYSSGEITTAESSELIKYLAKEFDNDDLQLYSGISYRHCLVHKNAKPSTDLTPPHDITDKKVTDFLPKALNEKYGFDKVLLSIMEKSYDLLKNHPINISRINRGLAPANSLWFWGEGTAPTLPKFQDKYNKKGAVISAVDLIKGIAIAASMTSIDVEGATGTLKSNFDGKAAAAIEALKSNDFVYIHLEAPDECGHQGDKNGKIKAIELIDNKIVNPIITALYDSHTPFKMLIVPDHATPLVKKTHTCDPVPFLMMDSENLKNSPFSKYTEKTAKAANIFLPSGGDLLKMLFE